MFDEIPPISLDASDIHEVQDASRASESLKQEERFDQAAKITDGVLRTLNRKANSQALFLGKAPMTDRTAFAVSFQQKAEYHGLVGMMVQPDQIPEQLGHLTEEVKEKLLKLDFLIFDDFHGKRGRYEWDLVDWAISEFVSSPGKLLLITTPQRYGSFRRNLFRMTSLDEKAPGTTRMLGELFGHFNNRVFNIQS